MNGSVQTLDLGDIKIHIYTPPAEGFSVNSTIFELADRLIVVDGQIYQRFASEVGDVIDSLHKPIDRFILTHNHPDHFSGFEHLTGRYPGVQLAALTSVRDYLADKGEAVLVVRRQIFGEGIATKVPVPDATIVPGELVIAGIRFIFQEFHDVEADDTLTITLPDYGVALVADLVAAADHHLFTVSPHFDAWADALDHIRGDVAKYGIKTIIAGHGAPVGPEVLPANIEYLETAKKAYAASATSEEWVASVSEQLPDRTPEAWLNWSSQMLYGHVAP